MSDVTGSVSTMGGSSGGQFNDNSEGKTTPRSFNVDKDARSMDGGGDYPNYWSHKTRSGHSFIMDDSQGNETVTIQHRSGSAIQMRPDGGMLLTTHNGKYEVVLGEERVTISGASDITVKGDTSLRCYGDYNVTVHKDYNLTVLGNMNVTSKNLNRSIRGTIDTEAKTENKRVEGSSTLNAQGAVSMVSKADMSLATEGKFQAASLKDFGLHHLGSGSMVMASAGKMYQKSDSDFNGRYGASSGLGASYGLSSPSSSTPTYQISVTSSGVKRKTEGNHNHEVTNGDKTTKVSGNHNVLSTGGNIAAQTQGGSIQYQSSQDILHKAASNISALAGAAMNMQAPSGTATFAGMTTNVNAMSGALNLVGAAAGINLDALGGLLNMQGGLGSLVSQLGLQLNFDFGESGDATEPPQLEGTQANQPTQEPDASGEIDAWV
jgi:hypothetical protein